MSVTERSPVGKDFYIRSSKRVRLGPVVMDIRSNEEAFAGFRYFSEQVSESSARPDYILNLCNICVDAPWPMQTLSRLGDRSYRGIRFAAGYYLTDHFGEPAYLLTRSEHHWVFAKDFEPILWPYLAKALLTFYSMERRMLHLKSAAVAVEGNGTLLVARGRSGKTVLLTHLCRRGAQFLSNTHVLLDGGSVIPIPSAMRIRNDELFRHVIVAQKLTASVKADEYLADPLIHMGWKRGTTTPLVNICLVDYRGPDTRVIHEMDREMLLQYMDQFSLALNVYGLKEDLLDHLGSNVELFGRHVKCVRAQLYEYVRRCRAYYVSCDAADPGNLESIYELLAAPQR